LVLGPRALIHDEEAPPIERILCATSSLETCDDILKFAGHLAARLGAGLELVHVIDAGQKEMSHKLHEQRCEEWSKETRARGIPVSWTVVHGQAEKAIAARAAEGKASLILFELHRSGNRMVDCPDGVVSATIREAQCAVMTIPTNLSRR
jgi:K+-sensing histidine kinase KdpD